MLKLKLSYPGKDEELAILNRMADIVPDVRIEPVLSPADLADFRQAIDAIYLDDKIKRYIVEIVHATRQPADYGLNIGPYIQYGASHVRRFFWRAARAARHFSRAVAM